MHLLRRIWEYEYLNIKINLRIVLIIGIVGGLWWLKGYYYRQGALAAFKYDMQQEEEKKHQNDDSETNNTGHLDHSNDPIHS